MPTDLKVYWEKAAKRQQSRDILISSPKPQDAAPRSPCKAKAESLFFETQCPERWKPSQKNINMFLVELLSTFLHPQLKNSSRKCYSTSMDALYFCPSWTLDNQTRYLFLKSFCKTVSFQEDIRVLAWQLTGSQRAQWVKWKTHQAILQPHTPATPLPVLFSSKHIWKQQAHAVMWTGPSLFQIKFGRVQDKHPFWKLNKSLSWSLYCTTLPLTSFIH